MIRWIHWRWISILSRVALGALFVYSAWPKMVDPPGFAQVLWNYRILPDVLIQPVALVLPWLEASIGVALLAGALRRGAALLAAALLMLFIAILAIDIVRGIPVDCGCFTLASSGKGYAELMREMKLALLRDLGMLAMAFQALVSRVTWV